MRTFHLAFVAVSALFAFASPSFADISFPTDAAVKSSPGHLHVTFHDGSQYSQSVGIFEANGAEAVSWFLKHTEDKFYGIFSAGDLVSLNAVTGSKLYRFKFSDGSELSIAQGMTDAKPGLAQKYLGKINEYGKASELHW